MSYTPGSNRVGDRTGRQLTKEAAALLLSSAEECFVGFAFLGILSRLLLRLGSYTLRGMGPERKKDDVATKPPCANLVSGADTRQSTGDVVETKGDRSLYQGRTGYVSCTEPPLTIHDAPETDALAMLGFRCSSLSPHLLSFLKNVDSLRTGLLSLLLERP